MTKPFAYPLRNFRDLGGAPVSGGGRIRTGLLYRSAQFDRPSAREVRLIADRGVTLAIDLRHDVEKAASDQRLEAALPGLRGVSVSLTDIIPDGETRSAMDLLSGVTSAADARRWMAAQFADTVRRRRPQALQVVEALMANTQGASLFFCVAGKDRTGVVAALLLMALGAPHAHVARDFDRTNRRIAGLPFLRLRSRTAKSQYDLSGVPNAVIDALADAHPLFLDAVYAVVDGEFGGVQPYLTGAGGIDPALLADFRRRLILA